MENSRPRGTALRYRVLGPVAMLPRTPTAAKLRMLLAALLLRANEVVSSQALIDVLWGAAPPRTVTTTLQVYISQLRTLLGEGDPDRPRRDGALQTRPPGYRLQVADHELDLTRFEQLRDSGRRAYENGDFQDAGVWLREALALWTGPSAVAGTPHGPLLSAAAVHLEESRLAVLEQRIAADLRLGRHQELAPELLTLATEHPFREALHAHLMVALYRSERQSDALLAFRRLRQALVEELGVEPGPRLTRLHERILRSDPSLVWKEPERSHGRAPVFWLPPGVHELVGREKAMAVADRVVEGLAVGPAAGPAGANPGHAANPASAAGLAVPVNPAASGLLTGPTVSGTGRADILASFGHGPGEPPVRLLAVSGRSGVGKTAFAVEVARRHADSFPDGQVLVHLRGAGGEALDAEASAAAVLRRLGGRTSTADGGQAQRELGRALYGRRMLLVLDDAVREEQVHPVSAALREGLLLVTSQRALVGLENAQQLSLEVLSSAEAFRMLQTLGVPQLSGEPDAAREIVRLCGRLPLALRVAGATLSARPHWGATTLVERLADRDASLDALVTGDLDVRAALAVGYRECGEAEQSAFRLLALAPDSGFSLWTARLLLRLAPAEAERCLERLVESRLLEVVGTGIDGEPRYGYHRLMRTLALELLDENETTEDREQAVRRLARGYVALTRYADSLLAPGRVPDERRAEVRAVRLGVPGALPHGEPAGVRLDRARIVGDAPARWFQEETPGILQAARQAYAAGDWTPVWQLAEALSAYLEASGRWREWSDLLDLGMDAARRLRSLPAKAAVLRARGDFAWQRGRAQRAAAHYAAARELYARVDDAAGVARCLIGAGDVALSSGDFERAEGYYREALTPLAAAEPGEPAALSVGDTDTETETDTATDASADAGANVEAEGIEDGREGTEGVAGTRGRRPSLRVRGGIVAAEPGVAALDPRSAADVLRGLALVDLLGGRAEQALRGFQEFTEAAERLGDQRWARFGQRNAERALAHLLDWYSGQRAPQSPEMEARPGVWLVRRSVTAGV